jgi:hypothetical protein
MVVKSTSKIASKTMSARTPFSKAGISLNSIWRPIFKNPQKRGPIPILARPARRLTSNGIPQKRVPKWRSKTALKIRPKRTQNRCLNEEVNEVLNEQQRGYD